MLLLAVWVVTLPVVSGIIEVSVLRHLHSDASLVDRSKAAIALPTGPVRRFRQVAVRRYRDGDACLADRSMPAIALPV